MCMLQGVSVDRAAEVEELAEVLGVLGKAAGDEEQRCWCLVLGQQFGHPRVANEAVVDGEEHHGVGGVDLRVAADRVSP